MKRAIGVIYLPETERISHYFQARLAGQFEAVLHFDATRGVEPLERTAEWEPRASAGNLSLRSMRRPSAMFS